jgi:hypothetical protein
LRCCVEVDLIRRRQGSRRWPWLGCGRRRDGRRRR